MTNDYQTYLMKINTNQMPAVISKAQFQGTYYGMYGTLSSGPSLATAIANPQPQPMHYSNNRYLIVYSGNIQECAEGTTLEQATEQAAQRAHATQSDAYVMKPVRKVAPKRDVVTTDLD